MSHYETLGVPKNASRDDVRKAYRKKAQKHHPDKGGKPDEFFPIQRAYDVLNDPMRREHYDATGDDTQEPDIRGMALQNIGALFIQIVEQEDVDHTNIVGAMRDAFKKAQAAEQLQLVELRRSIVKREKALKRVRHKGAGPNILEQMLNSDIAQRKQKMDAIEQKGLLFEEVFRVLKEYEYATDERTGGSAFHSILTRNYA